MTDPLRTQARNSKYVWSLSERPNAVYRCRRDSVGWDWTIAANSRIYGYPCHYTVYCQPHHQFRADFADASRWLESEHSGSVDVSDYPGLYVTFPLAGVFYCLFLMTHMLEKEVAKFDAEQREHRAHDVPDNQPESIESLHGREHHQPMRA